MSSLSAIQRPALQWRVGDPGASIHRALPEEVAVGLAFNGHPHTVLMATPAEVEDLALGFTITENIADAADVAAVTARRVEAGFLVDVRLRPGVALRQARERGLESRSSCGLCGVRNLVDAVRPLPRVAEGGQVTHQAIQAALAALEDRQPLGRLTRATHAAAFARGDGVLTHVREDVGRHNALDKLAGALARDGADATAGFILVTSRCSFEMVEKAVRIGCPILVAVSAPTELAIAKAEESGLTLVALARSDGHTIFTRADRLGERLSETV